MNPQDQEPQALPERAAFDKWWAEATSASIGLDPAWAAWRARSALATQEPQRAEPVAREDARQLKLHAAGLTYNDTTAEGEAKHRLHEIAMRIETGYCSRATRKDVSPPPPDKTVCVECNGTGQVFGHDETCTDDHCALNGDMHSCTGQMWPCAICQDAALASPPSAPASEPAMAINNKLFAALMELSDAAESVKAELDAIPPANRAACRLSTRLTWPLSTASMAMKAASSAPSSELGDWRIDHSAGRPILVYKDCSVIEAEQAYYVLGLLKTATSAPAEPLSREALLDIIGEHLTSLYACTRVWEAWSVGTMTADDFVPASETEFADDLAGSILAVLAKQGGAS